MKGAWIALVMLMACASWAQTPNGSRTTGNSPSKAGQIPEKAQEKQYPTKNSPLPVTVIPSPQDAAHAASREGTTDKYNNDYLDAQVRLAEASEKQSTAAITAAVIVGLETIIAGFALWFLMKTYGETRRTAIASIKSARAARKAANAAELSANAVIGVELPKLLLSKFDFMNPTQTLDQKIQYSSFSIEAKNYGRTPAFIERHCIEVSTDDSLPEVPSYRRIARDDLGTAIVQDGIYQTEGGLLFSDGERPNTIPIELVEKIREGEMRLRVFGFIEYKDFFGRDHETRFCKIFFRIAPGQLYFFADDRDAPKAYTDSH